MTDIRNIRMLTRYTAWADERLYAALAAVPGELLTAPRPGRADGMRGTLGHIYVVDTIWQAHLEGRAHGRTSLRPEQPMNFAELHAAQAVIDRWYIECADAQDPDSLAQVVDFTFVGGGAGAMRCGDMLLHVVNHKTFHRGYVADMLYESGAKPPTMDLPVFLRDAPPRL